jgi:hypothetical protein
MVPTGNADDADDAEPIAYVPHAGDLVLFRTGSFFFRAAYRITVTGPPTHVGIVVVLPDGAAAILESVDRHTGVRLMSLPGRLQTYPGQVWVRRMRTPLTPEQSAGLTQFAIEQEGKRFASHRLILPALLPLLRCRQMARLWPDKDYQSRRSWFCSELVAAACVRIGLFPASRIRPWCTFPLDFYHDDLLDLSEDWEPPLVWKAEPEAVANDR